MAQVSSVEDLNHFIAALKQYKIVTKPTLDLMTEVHADLGNDGLYSFGWLIGWGEAPFFLMVDHKTVINLNYSFIQSTDLRLLF